MTRVDLWSPESLLRIFLETSEVLCKGMSSESLMEPEMISVNKKCSQFYQDTHETVGTGALFSQSACLTGGEGLERGDGIRGFRGSQRGQGGK